MKWRHQEVYLPEFAIGRLVETPAEMVAILDAYLAQNGVAGAPHALVTGYDFGVDSARHYCDILKAAGPSWKSKNPANPVHKVGAKRHSD